MQSNQKQLNHDPNEVEVVEHHAERNLSYLRFLPQFLKKARLLAYTNEVAESFRHAIPKLITPLYTVAFGYIGIDIVHSMYLNRNKPRKVFIISGIDQILFHGIASIALPGIIIHQTVKQTGNILKKYNFSIRNQRQIPIAVGLLLIPLIIKPIDHFVDHQLLDKCIRPYYGFKVKEEQLKYINCYFQQ